MSMTRKRILILIASTALMFCGYESFGQSLDDSAARAQLAAEITQKYGVQVSRDLSLPELYAIVTGLNEILSIARQDHASLEAGDCRSPELGEMEARIAMANRINQQFGTSLDWRQYDFLELFMLDEKLRGKSQTAEK
jgi:tetrahydromethanopterin S-methyltransferase subunit G